MKCQLCQREEDDKKFFEKHHLIPQNKNSETILVCTDCGDSIHQLHPNTKLKSKLNTLEKLLEDKKIQNWIEFIKSKPFGKKVPMAKKKRRK